MKKFKDIIKEKCPNTKELIEDKKLKPTTEERIEALENAIADLAVMMTEV